MSTVKPTQYMLRRPDTPQLEIYKAPKPPDKGRIIGIDCHPDFFTAAVFRGMTPHDAQKLSCHQDLSLEALLRWAKKEFGPEDLFLMEAGSNSFEICRRLASLGLRAVVLESAYVGRHAKTYADNDKIAAARIVLVYLAGNAPCVWVPTQVTVERRELLHAHQKSVRDLTAAVNAFKGYLNQYGIRLGKSSPYQKSTRESLLKKREWTPLQQGLLRDHFEQLDYHVKRRAEFVQLIHAQVCSEPLMLRCMKLLGIGVINAFALLAVIGDVKRFASPEKLVAYIGLNPGQRLSGNGKHIKLGVGTRGHRVMRNLLVQGAQAVLRLGKQTPIGEWGWRLFARKGVRNVAVTAIARKLAVQIWHVLTGNPSTLLEGAAGVRQKLSRLLVKIGSKGRAEQKMPGSLNECVELLLKRITSPPCASL